MIALRSGSSRGDDVGLFKRRPVSATIRLMAAARLPTAGGEIPVGDIALDVVRRQSGRAAASLAVVEELLAEEGDAPQVALSFLEALQNSASHGSPDLLTVDELLPLRGPLTVTGWEKLDRFWHGVALWCDENGVELEPAGPLRGVQSPQLRSITWPSSRSLADGRRVRLSDVLRYEKGVGTPLA
jgi:hypothetical protein